LKKKYSRLSFFLSPFFSRQEDLTEETGGYIYKK